MMFWSSQLFKSAGWKSRRTPHNPSEVLGGCSVVDRHRLMLILIRRSISMPIRPYPDPQEDKITWVLKATVEPALSNVRKSSGTTGTGATLAFMRRRLYFFFFFRGLDSRADPQQTNRNGRWEQIKHNLALLVSSHQKKNNSWTFPYL